MITHLFLKAVTVGTLSPPLWVRGVAAKAAALPGCMHPVPSRHFPGTILRSLPAPGSWVKLHCSLTWSPLTVLSVPPFYLRVASNSSHSQRLSSPSGEHKSSPVPHRKWCPSYGPSGLLSERVVGPRSGVRLEVVSRVGETLTSQSPWSMQTSLPASSPLCSLSSPLNRSEHLESLKGC